MFSFVVIANTYLYMDSIISSVIGMNLSNPSSETVEDYSDSDEIVGMKNLPDEILLEVFKYFTPKEKLTQLSLVSRHWEVVARDPGLYRKLVFNSDPPSTRMAVKLVKMASQLVSLDIDKQDDTHEILRHVGIDTPRLKVLKVVWKECTESPQTLKYLTNIFMNCSKLRNICLQGCPSDMVWSNVVEYCKKVEAIKTSVLSDNDLSMICKTFRHSLKALEICDCLQVDASLIEVSKCVNLTKLHLNGAYNISEESLVAIGELLNLEDFELTHANQMTAEGWMRLFRQPMLEKLTNLMLFSFHQLDDDVARAILKSAKVLKRLTLMFCGIPTLTVVEVQQITSHLHLDNLLLLCRTKTDSSQWCLQLN